MHDRHNRPRGFARAGSARDEEMAAGDEEDAVSEKKRRAAIIRKAATVKEKFLRATAIQATLDERIATDPKYEWARTVVQETRFKDAKAQLQDAIGAEEFHHWWITNDISAAKELYGNDLLPHLERFLKIADAVTNLEKEQMRFQKMHRANQ